MSTNTATTATTRRSPTLREYLGVSLYWFATSIFWGSILVMILPQRVEQIVGRENKDFYFSIVLSVGAAVAAITQLASGALSDVYSFRFGKRKPFIVVGTLLASITLLFFHKAESIASIITVYIAIQFFLNVAIGPYQALLPDIIPLTHHGVASAYMGMGTLLGRIGGPMITVIFLSRPDGLKWLFCLFAFLLTFFMIINALLIKEPQTPTAKIKFSSALKSVFDAPLKPYPSFVWVMISRFGIMMGVFTVMFCLFYYVKYTLAAGTDLQTNSYIRNFMIVATMSGIISTFPAGKLADKHDKKSVLYVANSICILSALLFLLARSFSAAYVAVAIFGIGFGAFQAIDWALGCNLLPENSKAKYLGIWGLSDTIPQIVAPLIAGAVAGLVNSHFAHGAGYRILMFIAIIYFTLGSIALKNIQERRAA